MFDSPACFMPSLTPVMRILWFSVLIVANASLVFAGELKIATVDARRLLQLHPEIKRIDQRLESLANEYTAENQRMMADHRRLKKEFDSTRAAALSAALTPAGRDKRMIAAEDKLLELMECESRIRDTTLGRRRQLDEERQRMRQRIAGKIKDLIRDHAREKGLGLVLDTSGLTTSEFEPVMYSTESIDITAAIEARLRAVVSTGKDASK